MKLADKIKLFEKLKTDYIDSDYCVEIFYEVLERCNALKKNYQDYMTTGPIDCDKELLRLSNANYDLCCALITMLLRQDHFDNGCFDKHLRKGNVQLILDKIINLLKTSNSSHITSFSEMAIHALNGYYVYALVDPRNNQVFYIGKGNANRVFSHEIESEKDSKSEKLKLQIIRSIENDGFFVKRIMVNWGLTETEAFIAEATLINLLNYMPQFHLTNEVSGHHVRGSMTVEEFELQYGAIPLEEKDIKHSILVIKINKLYKRDMTADKLYDTVRGFWSASLNSIRTRKVKYVFGVYNGLIVAVYKPDEWHYGYEMVDIPQKEILKKEDYERLKKRVYFICKDYTSLDDDGRFYLNKSIINLKSIHISQNPITYLAPKY